jgi:hypothetical protein
MRAVHDLDAATRNLDIVEGLRLAHAAGDIIAAHVAAATAKERQAREVAEGENARLREALNGLLDSPAALQSTSVEILADESARRSKARAALAPAPAGGKP